MTDQIGTAAELFQRSVVDGERKDLFLQIGRDRSPFHNADRWRYLDEAFQSASQNILASEGHHGWEAKGGINTDGYPTLRPNSEAADDVLLELECNEGGFLWDSNDGVLAIRIMRSRRKKQRFGLAVQLRESADDVCSTNNASTLALPSDLRLGGRCEQLLWLIHSEVMRNRQSMISFPADLLREVIWGDRAPRNWRQDVECLVRSLLSIRVDVLNLDRRGWQPRLGTSSRLVDHIAFSWNLGELGHECDPTCQYWGTSRHHHHVRVGIGHGFLGALRSCVSTQPSDLESVDFRPKNKDDRSKMEPCFPMLNAILARRSKCLSPDDRAVLRGLLAEMTWDRDKPRLQIGNSTPSIPAKCPFLSEGTPYFSFNGNGKRPGYGYRIIGQTGRGWVFKTGLSTNSASDAGCKRLFGALDRLSEPLGLVVVGYSKKLERWFSLEELISHSRNALGRSLIRGVLLRIYGVADFDTKLKELIGSCELPVSDRVAKFALSAELVNTGLTHRELAAELDVSRPFVTDLLNGRKEWPDSRVVQARDLLRRLAASE